MKNQKFASQIITEKLQSAYVATSTFDVAQGMTGQGKTRNAARRNLIKQIIEKNKESK